MFSVSVIKKQKTHTDPIGAEEELLSGSDHGADTQIMFWLFNRQTGLYSGCVYRFSLEVL